MNTLQDLVRIEEWENRCNTDGAISQKLSLLIRLLLQMKEAK